MPSRMNLLPPEVRRLVAQPSEYERVLAGCLGVSGEKLLFSAKEAVYKAWFPATRRWLNFNDVEVTPIGPGELEVAIMVSSGGLFPQRVTCRWIVQEGLIVTAVVVDA